MRNDHGQTVIVVLIFVATAAVLAAAFLEFLSQNTFLSGREISQEKALHLADAGLARAIWEIRQNQSWSGIGETALGDGSYEVTVTTLGGNDKKVEATGYLPSKANAKVKKKIRAILTGGGVGSSFYYGVQVGAGGLIMDENSEVRGAATSSGNVYSNGSIVGANGAKITGNITAAGTSTMDNVIVLGTGRAHAITNSRICGDAYYTTIDQSSLNFVNDPASPPCNDPLTPGTATTAADSPVENMPISSSTIQVWKDDAAAGGTINGNCGDNGAPGCNIDDEGTLSLGPKKINGNLVLTKKQTMVVTGTLYFTGYLDIDSSSGATIKCNSSYGANSCIVITDSWVHMQNNATFQGSGTAGSYIIILSTLAGCNGGSQQPQCTHYNAAMDMHNNATGAIFYAPESMINLHNGVNVTEVTAYKLRLDNNAIVTYEQGLANAQFSSGPAGGWKIKDGSWSIIE